MFKITTNVATKVGTYPSSCLSFLPDFSDLSGCVVSLEMTTASCELTQLPIVLYARLQFLFHKGHNELWTESKTGQENSYNCLVYKILSGLGKAQMLSIKRIHSKEAKKMN